MEKNDWHPYCYRHYLHLYYHFLSLDITTFPLWTSKSQIFIVAVALSLILSYDTQNTETDCPIINLFIH